MHLGPAGACGGLNFWNGPVRWGVTRRIVWAWVLTMPGAAIIGAGLYLFLGPFSF